MFEIFITIMVFVLFFFVFLYPKGYLAYKVKKNCSPTGKVSTFKAINCYIPFYNNVVIRKSLFGSAPLVSSFNIIFVVIVGGVLAFRFLYADSPNAQLLATGIMYFNLLLMYAVELFVQWDLVSVINKKGYRPLVVLLPPLASFLLAVQIDKYFKSNKDAIEGTFEG